MLAVGRYQTPLLSKSLLPMLQNRARTPYTRLQALTISRTITSSFRGRYENHQSSVSTRPDYNHEYSESIEISKGTHPLTMVDVLLAESSKLIPKVLWLIPEVFSVKPKNQNGTLGLRSINEEPDLWVNYLRKASAESFVGLDYSNSRLPMSPRHGGNLDPSILSLGTSNSAARLVIDHRSYFSRRKRCGREIPSSAW